MSTLHFHILIVEDNEQLGGMYERILQHHNYRTLRLKNAHEAITQFIPFDPDLILLDWALEDGNCEPFLRYLNTLEAKNRPPILLISAEASAENIRTYQHSITDSLPKPISMKDLLKKVADLIPLAQQRVRFEQIAYKQLAPNKLYMEWVGNITPNLIRKTMHPHLLEARVVVFDIRQLNTNRFQMYNMKHPALPNLETIHVICMEEQITFANFLIQFLNNATQAKTHYYTDPEQAVSAALRSR